MHMDAYAKQYLGWLDLKTLNAGDKATFKLGPAEHDNAETLIALALAEDLGQAGDLTARATIPESARGAARFSARQPL